MSRLAFSLRTLPSLLVFGATLASVLVICSGASSKSRDADRLAPNRAAADANSYALLVGIDHYQNIRGFTNACKNDVATIKDLLVRRFKFPNDEFHIKSLIDERATHEAIITNFKNFLIDNAKQHPGATVVFYFSGHGSTADDPTRHKPSGIAETIIPVDSRDAGNKVFDIYDFELNDLIDQLGRQQCKNITIIIDSCNSGTVTKAPDIKEWRKDSRPQPKPAKMPGASVAQAYDPNSDFLHVSDKYAALTACSATELASVDSIGQVQHSVFTAALARVLDGPVQALTYRTLADLVLGNISTDYHQHPQAEGDRERLFLNDATSRDDVFIPITKTVGTEVTLDAGAAQAIRSGSTVAVYGPNAHHWRDDKEIIGSGLISKVDPFTSMARINATRPIPRGAKALLVAPNFTDAPLYVAAEPSEANLADRVKAFLGVDHKLNSLVRVDATKALFSDSSRSSTLTPWDAAIVRATAANGSQIYQILPRRSFTQGALYGLTWDVHDPMAPDRMALALEHYAKQRNLARLQNRGSSLTDELEVAFVTGSVEGSPDNSVFIESPRETGRTNYSLKQKSPFRLFIANKPTSRHSVWVTVLDLQNDGRTRVAFPGEAEGGNLLRPGQHFILPSDAKVYLTQPPTGTETFKVIFTTKPARFAFIGDGVIPRNGIPTKNAANVKSPLEWLMMQAAGGRKAGEMEVGVNDWTTAEVRLDIQ